MSIRLPRGYRRQTKAMQNWGELNRWTTDADGTITDILASLEDTARAVERLMNPTAQSLTTLTSHAITHLPSGSDPLATGTPGAIQADDTANAGSSNAFARSDHRHAITTDTTAALATAAAEGTASTFSRSDHVHLFPPSLRTTGGVAGDLLTLTSDGSHETLALSRVDADLILQDNTATTMARLFNTTGTDRGLWVNGHCALGRETSAPFDFAIVNASERSSVNPNLTYALQFNAIYDNAVPGTVRCANFLATLGEGLSSTGSRQVIGTAVSFGDDGIATPTVNTFSFTGNEIDVRPNLAGGPMGTLVGLDVVAVQGAGSTAATSYGVRVAQVAGTAAFAASFAGAQTQIATTQQLGFGRAQGTSPTNWLKAKTSLGSILQMALNSVATYEFATTDFYPSTAALASLGTSSLYWNNLYTAFISADSTALFPRTSALVGLGKDGNGFLDLWLKDTSAAFENRVVFTSSAALSADRTLTIDVSDGSRTIDLQGNPTLSDWFDQSVKTTGTPQFARIGIGGAADGTILLTVNDGTTAPATNAASGVVNRYGGDSNYCGDPPIWLNVRISSTNYKIPCYN